MSFFGAPVVLQSCCLYLISDLLQSGLLSFQDAGPESGEEGQAAVIVIEDDPTVSAGGGSETTLTDPAMTPQSSPQRSPQRKFIV